MREIEVVRNGDRFLRWTAYGEDSAGMMSVGVGFTRNGALRDLRARLGERERYYVRREERKGVPREKVEVEW